MEKKSACLMNTPFADIGTLTGNKMSENLILTVVKGGIISLLILHLVPDNECSLGLNVEVDTEGESRSKERT